MDFAERLRSGKPVFTSWSGVPDALTVEAMARLDYDAVTLDMQHGGHDTSSVLRSIPVITGAGKYPVVRIPVGRFDMASRALDFGAQAVIAPMINTIDDAKKFAAAMKYPPLGERSWGPTFAMPRSTVKTAAEWLATQNQKTVSLAMIETREAYAIAGDILALPGIDGVFVGPSDFSLAWTNGRETNPGLEDMMEAIADIASIARQAGKFAAIYAMDPAISGRYATMGYQMFAFGNEQGLMRIGADSLLATARGSFKS